MSRSPIQIYLEGLRARHAPHTAGRIADYIPEQRPADPVWLGICMGTWDGRVYKVGDSRHAANDMLVVTAGAVRQVGRELAALKQAVAGA